MRQYIKRQCLEILSLLDEAHAEVIISLINNKAEAALDILEQCQQGAISVGEMIDKSEGEGTEEVRSLERYCEMIWQVSEDIKNGGEISVQKTEKMLRKLLLDVLNGIQNRIPTRREIVFLPYKASMWDSLESVWRKLDADPDVTARVIPIPYYDKNPDGSFKQLHYEGTQFPADIPIELYEDYDLEAFHPDAIYIHNPYDEANYVTSVHPKYYSSVLKKQTEELVYIPYFVLGEIDPSNKAAVEGVEHFITLPGVVNAHKVIVQSPEWRQVYIDVMSKNYGEETRAYWENKIDGSGSPKMERVKNLKEDDFEIPEEWRKITDRTDGSGSGSSDSGSRDNRGSRKKIVFYNTGVSALLQEDERMLDKIERVFEIFKENKEDVVLLWRPHPLMEATLTSMRAELWERYKKIVDDYRASGWGIYDDTPELDRAIAVSDAYYGDPSSVVQLYKETGKPIMIQNVNV